MKRLLKTLIKPFLAILSGISFSLRLLNASSLTGLTQLLAFLIPILIFGTCIWLLGRTKLYQRVIKLPARSKIRWVVIAAFGTLFLMLVLPYEKPVIKTTHTMTIKSVENRYAPEERPVLITDMYFVRSGKRIPFDKLSLRGWTVSTEGLQSNKTGSVISYSDTYSDGIIIEAPTEFEYGMIEVNYDGKVDRYNLSGYPWDDPDFILLSKHSWGTPSFLWFVIGILGIMGDVWLIFSSFFFVIFSLAHLPRKDSTKVKQPVYMIFLYAVPLLIVWTILLLAFWPGIIPYDPLSQLSQAKSGIIYDDHPAIHTIFMQIILKIWDSPAPIIIIRYVLLSIVIGYGIWTFRRSGMPAWIAWVISASFAISPVTATTSINLWKDVPYAIAFLFLVILVFRIIVSHGEWLEKTWHWIILACAISFVAVFRHNGVLPALALIVLGCLFYRALWRKWVGVTLIAVFIYGVIVNPLYQSFNVKEKSAQANMFGKWLGYGLASYVYEEVDMSTDTMLYLDNITSVKSGWNYDCYSFSRSFGTGEGLFPGGRSTLFNFLKLFISEPEVYWHHWLCNTEHLWRLRPNDNPMAKPWAAYVSDISLATAEMFDLDYQSESKLPALKHVVSKIVNISNDNSHISWFIWRPALYFYIVVAAGLFAKFRSKNNGYLVFILLLICQTASLAIGIGSAWVRYSFPMMVTAMLFWPLLFWNPVETNTNSHSPKNTQISELRIE
ncbi:MAG: hypothetical protein SVR94_13415 [Pseudomonadota bacterium]|nr:hypothetical protein [Pseudomonadota bacterium]